MLVLNFRKISFCLSGGSLLFALPDKAQGESQCIEDWVSTMMLAINLFSKALMTERFLAFKKAWVIHKLVGLLISRYLDIKLPTNPSSLSIW